MTERKSRPVRVALVDTALAPDVRVGSRARFDLAGRQACGEEAVPVITAHGTALARIIRHLAPACELLSAQVFQGRLTTSPAAVAAGISWATEQGARLIHLSLGVRADRPVLRTACQTAIARGCLVVAAAPARGARVYPAGYEDVIRVMGDARCRPHEISYLGTERALFGAPPRWALEGPPSDGAAAVRGASCAAAYITGHLAALLAGAPHLDLRQAMETLAARARYVGPERRQG